ncbi:MAG TPA: LysR substrate-binding domain-containing protein [Blastocatellia bacterium]|nr:LysR substrate-binding domain-containing protein [Blastocatellia bacterium]
MKLRQLKYILEVYRQGNNISAAADALNTSQPGLSKQIQLLEAELGFAVFERTSNKVIGLTEPGEEVIEIVQRIMNDVQNLRAIREEYGLMENGDLRIATTPIYARYVLPQLVDRFLRNHRRVKVRLLQGNSAQARRAVQAGEADIAVCASAGDFSDDMVILPSFTMSWTLIAKKGHPILAARDLTLHEIAKYQIVTNDPGQSDESTVLNALEKEGLKPDVVFSAVDADTTKTYVELGLGIAILPAIAVDPLRDRALGARDAGQLFEPSTTHVCLRRHAYVRLFVFDFIRALDPALSLDIVRAGVEREDLPSQECGLLDRNGGAALLSAHGLHRPNKPDDRAIMSHSRPIFA